MRTVLLTLPYPPSANTCWRCVAVRAGARVLCRTLLSRVGRGYRDKVSEAVGAAGWDGVPLEGALALSLHLYPPDKRRRDIDNCVKPLLDALEHVEVFRNDYQVSHLSVMRHPPKEKPGYITVALVQTAEEEY